MPGGVFSTIGRRRPTLTPLDFSRCCLLCIHQQTRPPPHFLFLQNAHTDVCRPWGWGCGSLVLWLFFFWCYWTLCKPAKNCHQCPDTGIGGIGRPYMAIWAVDPISNSKVDEAPTCYPPLFSSARKRRAQARPSFFSLPDKTKASLFHRPHTLRHCVVCWGCLWHTRNGQNNTAVDIVSHQSYSEVGH